MTALPRRERRERTRFEVWAWSPVIVLRVALVITYLVYVYAGVIAFLAGIPLFSLVAWEGYTSVWAAFLVPSAVLATVGAIADHWERVERIAAGVLTAVMSGYVIGMNLVGFALGDLNRQFIGAIAVIAIVLPATRFVYLAAQAGKKRQPAGGDGE